MNPLTIRSKSVIFNIAKSKSLFLALANETNSAIFNLLGGILVAKQNLAPIIRQMNIVEKTSIDRIKGELEGFHRANNQFNFRCPYCGDSAKSKLKMRGWLFEYNGKVFYKCFNCDKATSYAQFLKDWFPTEHRRYISDLFHLKKEQAGIAEDEYTPKNSINRAGFIKLPGVKSTESGNKAAEYLDSRKITNREDFFYTANYGALLRELELTTYNKEYNCKEERLLIPHFNREGQLTHIQMRVLNNSKIRYKTYKVLDEYKLWHLDQVNLNKKIYITEGALDASFVENSVAMSGSDAQLEKSLLGNFKDRLRLILDNEPYSPIILQKYHKLIEAGYHVFHWPDIPYKDINDCIIAGFDITSYIYDESNYFYKMSGLLKFNKWRKNQVAKTANIVYDK